RLVGFGMPGSWLLPLLVLVSLRATAEVLSLMRSRGHQPIAWLVYLGNALIPLSATVSNMASLHREPLGLSENLGGLGWPLLVLVAAFAAVIIAEMARYDRPGTAIVNAALATFMLVYSGLLIRFWALLRFHRA